MTQNTRETVYLKNYQPTPHTIEHVNLTVKLDATETFVMMSCRVVPRVLGAPLEFHGEDLKLLSVAINGEPISDYELTNGFLIISSIPKIRFDLEIVQSCNPSGNTQLSGLYLSNGIFCTQMEAEGFRRFAYFYDRPDVMTTYRSSTFWWGITSGKPEIIPHKPERGKQQCAERGVRGRLASW